jgi:hypothetical protein
MREHYRHSVHFRLSESDYALWKSIQGSKAQLMRGLLREYIAGYKPPYLKLKLDFPAETAGAAGTEAGLDGERGDSEPCRTAEG